MQLSPIILFAYNRPLHTRQTLEALRLNELAETSELFIFCDGAKHDTSESDKAAIAEVREIARLKKWCGTVHIFESENNKGLAASITAGVTSILGSHGRVIVLEDDIVTAPGFLDFMNKALDFYDENKKIMHVSGYMYPLETERTGTCFLNVVTPWGWATWKDRWQYFENDAVLLKSKLLNASFYSEHDFNKGYGSEFTKQLDANIKGTLNTWAVKWHTAIYLQQGYCLHPLQSLVKNIGFDNSGEHCGDSDEYNVEGLADNVAVEKIAIEENKEILVLFENYYKKFNPLTTTTPTKFQRIKSTLKRIINI